MTDVETSVVLPTRNEADSIADVVAGCRAHTPDATEILVVDDGSQDRTAERASRAGATVIRIATSRGKGHAVKTGLQAARGSVVVLMDADGQDDPADIPRLLEALGPGVAMVIGSRFAGTFEPGSITSLHWWGNRGLTALVNALYGTSLSDTQAGFKCIRRRWIRLDELRSDGYDIEVELLLNVLVRGGAIEEVPVKRKRRDHGASGLRTVRDGVRILGRILDGYRRHRIA